MNMRKKLFILILMMAAVQGVCAQTDFGNVPDSVNASDATITKMGHLTMTMTKEVVLPSTLESIRRVSTSTTDIV